MCNITDFLKKMFSTNNRNKFQMEFALLALKGEFKFLAALCPRVFVFRQGSTSITAINNIFYEFLNHFQVPLHRSISEWQILMLQQELNPGLLSHANLANH